MSSSMSSDSTQSGNQGQQWPFTDNIKNGSHMEFVAALAVILIFILISFHLYVRYRRRSPVVITIHRGRPNPPIAAQTGGLDASAIAALPTFINRAGSSSNDSGEECPVCLSVAEEGEMMRLLPDCKHVFHIECIDMWLNSHSTCPVCRTKAKPTTTKSEFGELLAAPPLPERFGRGGGARGVEEGGSESSQDSGMGNGSRRWISTVESGVVDLERQ